MNKFQKYRPKAAAFFCARTSYLFVCGIALLLLMSLAACGPTEAELKARKQLIMSHLQTLVEVDKAASTGSYITGPSTSGPQHPSFLKTPYPTAEQMQQAMGKADHDRAVTADDGSVRALNWWEPDPSSDVYIGGGKNLEQGTKHGVHNIVTAFFDKDGTLRSIVVYYSAVNAAESIGRSTSDWRYSGPQ